MNLNLSTIDWLNAALGVLFLYRGIRDLYNGTGTGWSSEDEKKHFRKLFGIASTIGGAFLLVNIFLPKMEPLHSILKLAALVISVALLISHLCYTLSNWARVIALVVDVIYLILYEIWEHSAD